MSVSADEPFDGETGTEVWKVCPDCDGEGTVEGETREWCGGEGGWRL
jgi:DnaJ-class molecular chaperone